MINSVVLKNFQRHKSLKVEFENGFNCILGSNNKGKSSIVRALFWVFNNSPAGDWMRRKTKKGCLTATVKLELSDGTIVKRVKGKGQNYYAINDVEYHEIGRVVPDEVKEALNLSGILSEQCGLNLSVEMQEELPFLMGETGSVRAGSVGVITGINVLEKVIGLYNKEKKRVSVNINKALSDIEQYENKVSKYSFLEDIDLSELDVMSDKLKKQETLIDNFVFLQQSFRDADTIVKDYKWVRKFYVNVKHLECLLDKYQELVDVVSKLNDLQSLYNSHKKFTKPLDCDFDGLLVSLDKIDALRQKIDVLEQLYGVYKNCKEQMKKIDTEIKTIDKQFKGKHCPVCGNIMTGVYDG